MVLVVKTNQLFFLSDRDSSDYSAVCVYSMHDIQQVFTEGKFKTPVTVETSFVKWVMFSGDLPAPRPGAVRLA